MYKCKIVLIIILFFLNYTIPKANAQNYNSQHKNDSRFAIIKVPKTFNKIDDAIGWYEFKFNIKNISDYQQPGIFLGRIGDADEVFLNGIKIGGEGIIGDSFIEATKVERLYRINKENLKFNSDNILIVKFMNTYLKGGIFNSTIIIGNYNNLYIKKLKQEFPVKAVEIIFITFFLSVILFYLFLYFAGARENEYITFIFFLFTYSICYLFESLIFYETGFKSFMITKMDYTISTLFPANILLFIIQIYKLKLNYIQKIIMFLSGILFFLCLFILNYKSYLILSYLYAFLILLSVYVIFHISIKAYIQEADESKPILIGIIVLGFSVVILILEIFDIMHIKEFCGDSLTAFGVPFLIICIMYALAERFVRIQSNIKTLSGKIIDAEEEERKRISREIHDGVGQSLIAIKLNLQMMDAKGKNTRNAKQDNQFQNLISEVSDTIEELRNIARNLRPAFMERINIKEIIEWYSKKFQRKTGINIILNSADEIKDINEKIKNNVYRIYQEALTNILKHSGANTVNIELKQEKNILFLKISDNGKGFDYPKIKNKPKGIGLATMQERVQFLDGTFRIETGINKGTSIYIEIPIK